MSYIDISKSEIEKVYKKSGVTGRQAASRLGITYKTFVLKLKKFGIEIKKRTSRYPELNDKQWLYEQYIERKKSIRQISKEINATVGAVHSAIRWLGIETRKSREAFSLRFPKGRFGKNHPNWKGGRNVSGSKGKYIAIYNPEHPLSNKNGYVLEHRLVMEKKLKRFLKSNEIVHHKDGNGHNNKILNLQLTSRKKHFANHFDAVKEVDLLKKIIVGCPQCSRKLVKHLV